MNANIWETPAEDWQHVVNLNLHGCLNGIRCVIPTMISANRPGCVVNTASGAGLMNVAENGGAPYCVAKFGVVLASEALQNDLKKARAPISTHVLCPALVATNFGANTVKTAEGFKDITNGFQRLITKGG